jgi:hypothetical protein
VKKTIVLYGIVGGRACGAALLRTVRFEGHRPYFIGFDRSELIGYTSMVVAFLLIFFGIRSYRDNVAGGSVSFGRAFSVGALILVVASLCYVVTWQVIYFQVAPDFVTKYQAHLIQKARAQGESQAAIDKKVADMETFAELYKNPAINASLTFLEPLPVGLIIALVSAGILRKRPGVPGVAG